jgi:hypothetical protein
VLHGGIDVTDVDLPHQARRVEPLAARDAESEPFVRARDETVTVDMMDDPGRYNVRVGDGDVHTVVLVEDDAGHVGACDCNGWTFHEGNLAGDCCAHLCAVAMEAALNSGLVPEVDEDLDVETVEAEVVEHGAAADQDDVVDANEKADLSGERADHAASPTPSDGTLPSAELDDPFASELEDVDDRFIMTLGGDPYIRREGFQRLARQEGYRVATEIVTWASETDCELAEARAEILEDGEVVATGTGTAYLPEEDLSGAAGNLNELAETRALSRAMGWATGAGLSAVEVDASAEYDGDREVATDGGL